MSKEDLLIALLKSNKSHAELRKSEYNEEIGKTKKLFNELTNNFPKEEILNYFVESIDKYLKELINYQNSLTKQEKQEKKRYPKNLKRVEEYLKKLTEDLNKLEKYQYNEDLDYKGIRQIENLFDKIDEEDYYKPIKTFENFDNEYIEYESRGDKDKKNLKKLYGPFLWMGFNCLKARPTSRRQFTFYH